MMRIIIGRLAGMLVAILGASFLAFVLLRVVPGNPARLILGPLAPVSSVEQLSHDMGLDQSIPQQYWRYVKSFVTGDWGFSYSAGAPVRTVIGQRFPATIELDLYAFMLGTWAALVLALVATYRRRPGVDRLVRGPLLPRARDAAVLARPGAADRAHAALAPPAGPRGPAVVDGHAAAPGDRAVHRRRPARRRPAHVLGGRAAPDPAGDHAGHADLRGAGAPAAGEPPRRRARAVPGRRQEQGRAALDGVHAPRAAERRAADDDPGGPRAGRAPDRQRARRAGLRLARRRRPRGGLDLPQGLRRGADVHPPERLLLRR